MKTPANAIVAVTIFAMSLPASAYDRQGTWTASQSTTYPVVKVYGCPTIFATQFPGFSWDNIVGHIRSALDTWFTEGGADLRLRYRGDLPNTDVRCAGAGTAGNGEVLITAEELEGSGKCYFGLTFGLGGPSSKVILFRKATCGGIVAPINWATNAWWPGSGQVDFQYVLLHEIGHAIGFGHSTDTNAIMYPSNYYGGVYRNLTRDEILGMQNSSNTYGPIQTIPYNIFNSPAAPSTWYQPTEVIHESVKGSPAISYSPNGSVTAGYNYLTAYTSAYDRTVKWGRTNGVSVLSPGFQSIVWKAWGAPAVASSTVANVDLLAFNDDGMPSSVVVYRNAGVPYWTAVAGPTASSRVPPALAYMASRNMFVLAWANDNHSQSNIVISTSIDDGTTWSSADVLGVVTYRPFGISCAQVDTCTISYSDAEPYSRVGFRTLVYNPSSVARLAVTSSNDDLGYDSYGASIAQKAIGGTTETVSFWRDRGTNTVLSAGKWTGAPGSTFTGGVTYTSSLSHSAPSSTFNPYYNSYLMYSSYADRYNQ